MSKTADDLIYEAASILGKNVAGESLGNVEYQTISAEVDNTSQQSAISSTSIKTIFLIGCLARFPILWRRSRRLNSVSRSRTPRRLRFSKTGFDTLSRQSELEKRWRLIRV